uniref:Immunoglobulin domain-containing protein n=1 Tax=Scleropages formosus TaxID=113540 RepID=A0A8C9W295_SCLFO
KPQAWAVKQTGVCHRESAAGVEKKVVKLGDNVTLHCSFTHLAETLWFGQRRHQTPFLILSVKTGRNGSLVSKCLPNTSESYIAEFNKENTSISLNILNIRASDLGLFYCLTTSGSMKYIGHGHLLYRGDVLTCIFYILLFWEDLDLNNDSRYGGLHTVSIMSNLHLLLVHIIFCLSNSPFKRISPQHNYSERLMIYFFLCIHLNR